MKSARYGVIKFNFEDLDDIVVHDENETFALDPLKHILFNDFFDDDLEDVGFPDSSLIYICGYVAFKMKTRIQCTECVALFLSHSATEDQYFQEINRGGLSVPSDLCMELGGMAHLVMQRLISEKYEADFVKCANQREVFIWLLQESLFLINYPPEDKCTSCGKSNVERFRLPFKIFSNILLNNYTKFRNNVAASLAYAERKLKREMKEDKNSENASQPKGEDPSKMKSSAARKLSTLKK